MHSQFESQISRRLFLQSTGGLAAWLATRNLAASPLDADANQVSLPPLTAASEAAEKPEPPALPREERVDFAVVGLGRIALERVLPAFAHSKYARVSALVSGSREKALKVARQYGVEENAIFDYAGFERLGESPAPKAVYIALPNGLHAEYTVRAARAKRHVLCEKPMAVSVAECQQMIEACRQANVKLMIGYRSQYEPLDRAIVQMVGRKQLGDLREFIAVNSQYQGDPSQWRLNRKLAGGGPLPDVGIYCINAARFMSGEEPVEVFGSTFQLRNDARFREVETSAQFTLKFPSGFTAVGSCSYATHRSQMLRIQGTSGWAELDPAFAYDNLQLRVGQVVDRKDLVSEMAAKPADQFAREIDHFAECILSNREPLTRGEEGMQDQRIIEALYRSANSGSAVKLEPPPQPSRGPAPPEV